MSKASIIKGVVVACVLGLGACQAEQSDQADQADGAQLAPLVMPRTVLSEDALLALSPTRTRAGHLRFTDGGIYSSEAAAVFLQRLRSGQEAPDVRAALVEALPRTGGAYAHALPQLLAGEPDVRVREVIMAAAKRAPAADAAQILAQGFADQAWQVRAEAARVAGARADAATYKPQLLSLQRDEAPATRQAAAEALSILPSRM